MNTTSKEGSLFELDGVPKLSQAFPLALQHVVAMIVGCVTPAIIISGAAGLETADRVLLIQASLVVSALATLLQLFPIGKKTGFHLGAGLPVIIGVSFAYVPSMQAIADQGGIPAILGAQIVGGVCAILVGLTIKKIRKFFPPLIAGTVVFTIGLSLYPTAINYMAGGTGSATYGSWQNWLVAIFTLVVVTGLNHFAKGFLKLASILIGMIIGYIFSSFFGMVSFSNVAQAGVFQLPQVLHFGITFEPSACIALGLLFVINSVQAIGAFSGSVRGFRNDCPIKYWAYVSLGAPMPNASAASNAVFLVYFMEDFSLFMHLQLVQHFYKVRIVMVYDFAVSDVQLCNLCHILCRQGEIPDVEVLCHTFRLDRLRNDNNATLDIPTQCHLCGTFAVFGSDRSEYRMREDVVIALGKRTPCLRCHTVFLHQL